MIGVIAATLAAGPICAEAARDMPAGRAVVSTDLRNATCRGEAPVRAFGYDVGAGRIIAIRSISAGEIVRSMAALAPAVSPGDRVSVRVRFGAISVERPAVALQTGAAGKRMFVRLDDGAIFAAVIEAHR